MMFNIFIYSKTFYIGNAYIFSIIIKKNTFKIYFQFILIYMLSLVGMKIAIKILFDIQALTLLYLNLINGVYSLNQMK